MYTLDHLCIAVFSLEKSLQIYEHLFQQKASEKRIQPIELLEISFINLSNIRIEFIAPLNLDSSLHCFLKKKGEGLHHLAFTTKDFELSKKLFLAQGLQVIEPPYLTVDNKHCIFIHPQSLSGTLAEFIQVL